MCSDLYAIADVIGGFCVLMNRQMCAGMAENALFVILR